MDETTITKKLVRLGNGLAIIIPNDIIEAMQLNQGTLLEIKLKDTGKEILPRINKKKEIVEEQINERVNIEEKKEVPIKEQDNSKPELKPIEITKEEIKPEAIEV